MKNILCKLATSVVFILQITNINLGYSSAQVYYGDNYRNYEREYKASENNDFVNNINMYSNNTRLNFDEQYQNNILKYLEKDVLNNDSEITVSNNNNIMDIINANHNTLINNFSTNFDKYISVSGGSGSDEEEESNLIKEKSIKYNVGAAGSGGDGKTKTCCDFLRNICNKLTSCIIPGSNNDKENYSPINKTDEQNDLQEPKILEFNIKPFDYFAKQKKELENNEKKYKKEFEESINKIMEDSKKRIYASSEKLIENMKMIGKEQSIIGALGNNSNTKTCYDFFKNTFNKLKSYIMPSTNSNKYNENANSQVDEEEVSLMAQDDDLNKINTNLQIDNNNEIELTPQDNNLQISQTNKIALMAQGELKKIDAKDLYVSYTPK